MPALGTTWPETGARVLVIGGSDEQQQAIRALYPEAHDLVLQHEIAGIAAQLDALGTVDHIVWIAPERLETSLLNEPPPNWQGSMPYAGLVEAQDAGVLQLFRLVKALLSQDYVARKLGWTLITTGALAVRGPDSVRATHAIFQTGWSAASPRNTRTGQSDSWISDAAAPWPWRELFALPPDPRGDAWGYRGGEWFRQELVPVREWPLDTSNLYRAGRRLCGYRWGRWHR